MVVVRGDEMLGGDLAGYEGLTVSDRIYVSDDPQHHVALQSAIEGAISLGISGDPVVVASKRVHSRNTADENVVNRPRFHKRRQVRRSHEGPRQPGSWSCLPAPSQVRTFRTAPSSLVAGRNTVRSAYGFRTVNDCNRSASSTTIPVAAARAAT